MNNYRDYYDIFWKSKYWKQNIAGNLWMNQNRWAREAQENLAGAAYPMLQYAWEGSSQISNSEMYGNKRKRVKTEHGDVCSPMRPFSFKGGVTRQSDDLGGITATGPITGGSSSAPLTIKIQNGGKKWITKFKDRRTNKFDKFFSPYWMYTYLRPNIIHTAAQDNAALVDIVEQGQEVDSLTDYLLTSIDSMARVTQDASQSLISSDQAPSGWQGIHNAMNGWAQSNSDAIFKVPLAQRRFTFRNVCNRRVRVALYEFTCIKSCDASINSVTALWGNYLDRKAVNYAQEGVIDNYDLGIGGVTSYPVKARTKNSLGSTPICKDVNEFWKCTGKLNAYMLPGRNIEWTTTLPSKQINRLQYDQYLAQGTTAIEGWTTTYILITCGDTVAGEFAKSGDPIQQELSTKSDYRILWTEDEQFVTNYTYKTPTVKHYRTSSLVGSVPPLAGVVHAQVATVAQRGVALVEAETPAAYDVDKFITI